MVSVVDLLSIQYAPIQTAMMVYLEVRDVMALSRTCVGLKPLWPMMLSKGYRINELLRFFVTDPNEFRSTQRQCDALVSGDFARRFITRSSMPCRFSKIYIHVDKKNAHILKAYLQLEGYQVTDYEEDNQIRTWQYRKMDTDGTPTGYLDLPVWKRGSIWKSAGRSNDDC